MKGPIKIDFRVFFYCLRLRLPRSAHHARSVASIAARLAMRLRIAPMASCVIAAAALTTRSRTAPRPQGPAHQYNVHIVQGVFSEHINTMCTLCTLYVSHTVHSVQMRTVCCHVYIL